MMLFDSSRAAGTVVSFPLATGVDFTWAWCPAGRFLMGSVDGPRSQRQHPVTLTRGFWIACTPVTQAVWRAVMHDEFRFRHFAGADAFPVECMGTGTAYKFLDAFEALASRIGWLEPPGTILLPTEAQWEYACRAGTQTRWYFGDDEAELRDHAWYRDNSDGEPQPVATKRPNPWGLFDVYGNVAEWCLDDLLPYPEHAEVDPIRIFNHQAKAVRGGAYTHLADECTSANRELILADNPEVAPTGIRPTLFPRVR